MLARCCLCYNFPTIWERKVDFRAWSREQFSNLWGPSIAGKHRWA